MLKRLNKERGYPGCRGPSMKCLLSLVICLVFLFGCSAARLPFSERLGFSSSASTHSAGSSDSKDASPGGKPSAPSHAAEPESVQASYSGIDLPDQF